MKHPIRNAKIHTFLRQDDHPDGHRWIAFLHPYGVYPIYFHGSTEAEVIEAAEATRAEAIEKHEAAYIARQEALAKARAAKAKKKEGVA